MKWMISVPVWGDRCFETFERFAVPGIKAALAHAGCEAVLLVHTDDVPRAEKIVAGIDRCGAVMVPAPPHDNKHIRLGLCHRDAVRRAEYGTALAFINADMVPSIEVFSAAERRFDEGRGLIMMASGRTIGDEPPIGSPAEPLLRWSMKFCHRVIRESFFGYGRSMVCSTVYFKRDGDIVMHGFHLHPFAALIDRNLGFDGVTVDCDFPENYREEEIHVVTDVDEAAFIEMSPLALSFELLPHPIDVDAIVAWARNAATSRLHDYFFGHAIRIAGSGDAGDIEVCDEVLRRRANL